VSLWGSDIGGYFSLSAPQLTPELLARWIEVGAVSGIMRTEADGFALPGKATRPQIFDPDVLPVWRRYAKLRTQLYPYLAAAEREYDTTGMPIMRQLSLVFPGDAVAGGRDDEFMFGPDLLAAPVIEPGAASRSLYLPAGRWVDLWRSASLGGTHGSLGLRRPALLTGGRSVTVPAPLAELPLFARAGTILPLLAPDVSTLTGYGRSPGLVHLADRAGQLRLLAFPRGSSAAAIGPGESVSSREGPGGWTLDVRGTRRRRYYLQASLATLGRPFAPCAVRVGRRALARRSWTYDRGARVLRATFSLSSGTLVARSRCARSRNSHNRP
jgi:hypothetical protein